MRMARIPARRRAGREQGSGAPGFWIGNVIVMAGVPAIMQAMLDEVAPKLQDRHEDAVGDDPRRCREGDIGTELGEIAKAHPEAIIGSYPFFDEKQRPEHKYRGALARCGQARRGESRGRRHAEEGESAAFDGALELPYGETASRKFTATGQDLSRFLGPVSPRLARARMAPA